MKSPIRWSKCSGSTRARILRIVRQGERAVRRQFVAASRNRIVWQDEGGQDVS